MLRSLSVENYVLIDRLEMSLGAKLNTLTGETGAGKSILLGALGLLVGERAEGDVQHDTKRPCVVEGVFALEDRTLEKFFAENELDFSEECTVRRVVSGGKSRAFVNDCPVSLAVLKKLGGELIDIHSQHENLLLHRDGFRSGVLDVVAGQGTLVAAHGAKFAQWRALSKQAAAAREAAATRHKDEEWLRHVVEELSAMRLVDGEVARLEAEQSELLHADELRETFGTVADDLGADDGGVVVRLRGLRTALGRVASYHAGAANLLERLTAMHEEARELERDAAGELDRVEGDPQRLERVVARLDAIFALQQKHRVVSVEGLLAALEEYRAQLDTIEHGDARAAELERLEAECEEELAGMAGMITEGRKRAAGVVEHSVVDILRRLGIAQARFVVEVVSTTPRGDGADEVRFMFSANATTAPRPIEKIGSGGEISRVMLALKTISTRAEGRATVVFDEIDAGVSGRVADAMGEVIGELATGCQVLNITHLPQIAAKPGEHFMVYKQEGATHIRWLSHEERVGEIAKMLSGSTVTEAAVEQARELLKREN